MMDSVVAVQFVLGPHERLLCSQLRPLRFVTCLSTLCTVVTHWVIKFVPVIKSEGIETYFKVKYLHCNIVTCANDSEYKIVVIITVVVAVVIVT
jgi:hypothetical protein